MSPSASQLSVAFLSFLLPILTFGSPIVLIPGDGASVLEVKYDRSTVPHWLCSKSSHGKWERLWVPNPTELLPRQIDCWSDKIRLQYNETNVTNAPGVEIRARPGREGLELVRDLPNSNVYRTLCSAFEDLTVATYDFRVSPRGNPQFLTQVKEMVEDAFEKSQTKVILLTHSLGALFGHYFLTHVVDAEWKDKFIQAWIPIAPAYGGVILGLKQLISGDTGGIPWLSGKDLKDEQRSYECSLWLLPREELYQDQVLVKWKDRAFTAQDYDKLFALAGFSTFGVQWDRIENLTTWSPERQLKDPNVTVYPIYGNGVDTPVQYDYTQLDREPTVVSDQAGDGTVSLSSLQAGNHWLNAQEPLVVNGVSHTDILSNKESLLHILKVVKEGISEAI
jgi:hypothetical protein